MSMRKSVLALAMAVVSASASAVTVDTFSGGTFDMSAPFSGQTSSAPGNAIGNDRSVSATESANNLSVQIDAVANPGKYSHSQTSGVTGTIQVIWNGGGGGFTATDFTNGGNHNAIRVYVNDTDNNAASNSLSITLNGTATRTYNFTGTEGTVFYIDFLLSNFATTTGAVTQVQMDLNGGNNDDWDIDIDDISTVCSGLSADGASSSPVNGSCGTTPTPPPVLQIPTLPPLGMVLAAVALVGVGAWRIRKDK